MGSWTTAKGILSLADCIPTGKGVFVGAAVEVAMGGGVSVGCSTTAAGGLGRSATGNEQHGHDGNHTQRPMTPMTSTR